MNMIEKIARAIGATQYERMWVDVSDLDTPAVRHNRETDEIVQQDFLEWHDFLPEARAALAAIAEPTEAMYAAGQTSFQEGHLPDEIYRRMIKAEMKG